MNESLAPARLPIATDSLSAELDGQLRAAGRRRRLMKHEARMCAVQSPMPSTASSPVPFS